MGKLLDSLNKQLETQYREEARDCILILNKLKEITGNVWSTDWNVLVRIFYIDTKKTYEPSEIGKVFLKGIL